LIYNLECSNGLGGRAATFNAAQAAEEFCRIVGQPEFYTGSLVDQAYI
jgi:hypothetical protein